MRRNMSAIEIPYMPISGFEASDVCKKYAKESLERTEHSRAKAVGETLQFPEENGVSVDIVLLLHGIGMEKYTELFRKKKIPLETFLLLSDSDLKKLGITDARDREIIVKNFEIYQRKKKDLVVRENHLEDLKIAQNAFNQLLLLQNYYAYIELKMKKHKFTDYSVGWKESACVYLKKFTESAIIQSKRLSRSLYVESHNNHLIGKLLSMYDLTLPAHLQEKLKRRKKRSYFSGVLKTMVLVGFCSIFLLARKCIFGRHQIL